MWKRLASRPPNPPDRAQRECRPRQGRHPAKGTKGVGPPQALLARAIKREAGRTTLGERSPHSEDDPGDGKHSGSSQHVFPSRGRRARWAFGGCGKRWAPQCPRARIGDHGVLGTCRVGALLLILLFKRSERASNSSSSVPPAGACSQEHLEREAPLAASMRRCRKAMVVEESVTGFGQPTREARSYRAVSLLFVSCCRSRTTTSRPKKLATLRRRR